MPEDVTLLDRESLLEIVSGERTGVGAALVRGALWTLSFPYRFVMGLRNRKFDQGKGVIQVDCPVISVGNLTTGGTGKSPLVIWISRYLRSKGLRVAVLSRGYGAKEHQVADEAIEFQQRLPDVPHLQNPNRVASAQIAIDELEMQALVLDDGFQHRKIARDLNVVVIDCTRPFGYGYLLPRGLLREPVRSLSRVDLVVLTRCEQVTQQEIERVLVEIANVKSLPVAKSSTKPAYLLQAEGQTEDLDSLRNKKVYGISGIGNPENFWETMRQQEYTVIGQMPFPDHHDYEREDINRIGTEAGRLQADAIVCTHKDLVKLGCNRMNNIPVYALVIELEFHDGEEQVTSLLDMAVASVQLDENVIDD